MTIHIVRRASAQDMKRVQALYSSALAIAEWLPEHARRAPDIAVAAKGELMLVCEHPASGIVGFASIHEPDRFIHHLYIAPGLERTGIGSTLMAELPQHIALSWRLKCLTANARAMAFYAKTGWLELSRHEGPEGLYALLEKNEA